MAMTQAGIERIAGFLREALEPSGAGDGDYMILQIDDSNNLMMDTKLNNFNGTFCNAVVPGPPVKVQINISTDANSIFTMGAAEKLKYLRVYRDGDGLLPYTTGTILIECTRTQELTFTNGGKIKINTLEIELSEV